MLYQIILYFVIVAIAEESSKYFFLKNGHGIIQNLTVSMTVLYMQYLFLSDLPFGKISTMFIIWFSTAIVRAITAIPGHACFGVFMGVFYGLARKQYNRGKNLAPRYSEYSVLCYQFYYMAHMIL